MEQDIRPGNPSEVNEPLQTSVPVEQPSEPVSESYDQLKPADMSEPSETAVVETEPTVEPDAKPETVTPEVTESVAPVATPEVAPVPVSAPVATPVSAVKSQKKSIVPVILVVLAVVVLSALAAGAAYYYRDKIANDDITKLQSDKATLESQLATEKAKNATTDTDTTTTTGGGPSATAVLPSQVVLQSIKDSITSGNTAALEGYSASSVTVVLSTSQSSSSDTPTQAVSAITSFIASAGTWDFNLSSATLTSYKAGTYKQYFPEASIVGKSTSGKVISFSFNADSKISTVFLAASADVLN